MTDTKKKSKETVKRTRRPWTPASLYKNLTSYMEANELSKDDSIGAVLDELKESIVESQTG